MKKCIKCGNPGAENGTTCEVCGAPLQEVSEKTSGMEETASAKKQEQADKAPVQEGAKTPETAKTQGAAKAQRPQDPARRPRRASGPQIYGQGEGMPNAQAMYGQQGMIRRDVQAHGAAGQTNGRPGNAGAQAAGQVNGRPGNAGAQAAGQVNGRPGNAGAQVAGQENSRPNNAGAQANGRPNNAGTQAAGQPMNGNGRPMNGAAGQPMNGAAGQPMNGNGRPMNGAAGQPVNGNGRPMNGAAGQPMNGNGRPMNVAAGQMMNGNGRPGAAPMVHPGRRMDAARAALKSPLFILIALLNTVCLAGAVAAIFMDQMNYSQFVRLIADINMPAQLSGYMESVIKVLSLLDSGMLPVNLALQLPNLFLCLGLWLVCITVRTADENMSGIGFLCMKVYVIFNMIVTCVVVLLGLILSVTLVVAAWVSRSKSMIILAAVMLAVMIITALAAIMYFFCYLATIKVCRLNAGTGEPYGQVSSYVAVVHVLIGLTGIVGLLSGIVNSEISNIAGSIGKIGWMVLFALWIFLYKGKMSEFED